MDKFTAALCRWASVKPDKAAFTDASDGRVTTWLQLASKVLRLYKVIKENACNTDSPVAILVDRKPDAVAAMLAVNAAGGWYVPVDAELSDERISLLLSVCRPSLIIDCAGTSYETEDCRLIRIMDIPGIDSCSRANICSCMPEGDGFTIPGCTDRTGNSPLFGIFTSGSTGMPKLVVKTFNAMLSFTEVYCSTFGFTDKEIFGNQIPFYFDASTKDIYSTLLLGAGCIIIPSQSFSFPVNLVKTLNDYRVSTIVWVPSALGIAAKFNVFSASVPEYLKNVLFVGERMPVKYLNVWIDSLPGCRFVNLYGSTEVAGNSCYYVIDRRFEAADILPVGKPFDETEVFLIDPESGLEAGEGEIAVAGPGLALGYYGDDAKTAASFRTLNIDGRHLRVYFSGDFGCRNEKGELVCISRRDSQIKHMGHRIELGEIESAAASLPFVDEACCFYDSEKEKIILCFSSSADTVADVRRALAEMLPKYELPQKYVRSDTLPHNRNGKIDRAALKQELGLLISSFPNKLIK